LIIKYLLDAEATQLNNKAGQKPKDVAVNSTIAKMFDVATN
jgi:hypothetical protein